MNVVDFFDFFLEISSVFDHDFFNKFSTLVISHNNILEELNYH